MKPLPAQIQLSQPLSGHPAPSPPLDHSANIQSLNHATTSSLRPARRRHEHRAKVRVSENSSSLRPMDASHGSRSQASAQSGLRNQLSNGQGRSALRPEPMNLLDGPRSPPGGKNTSHVPCKFFKQGACQAGKACPFSHSIDPTASQAPCKYFSKGNCKFGAKCALAHVLPDGRIVNKPAAVSPGVELGPFSPDAYPNPPSALANSLLHAPAPIPSIGLSYAYPHPDEFSPLQPIPPPLNPDMPPTTADMGFMSYADSNYGSPRDESRFPISPAIKGLSALDAPLPASFDSNGISWIARNGPVAASVPSKFGLESPPRSFREQPASDALRSLHDSAYGNGERSRLSAMASTPPSAVAEASGLRMMHSQRYTKPKTMSASLPRQGHNEDWDSTFTFEEDFIPNSLQELLTPQEKMRRFSRSNNGEEENGSLGARFSLSGLGTPGESSSKVGSPIASSPSRFGPLFSRQRREEEGSSLGMGVGVGHVGSPLRNSTLHPGASPGLRAINRPTPGDVSPYFTSPPRQSSMSIISQQLQRTRLSKSDTPTTTISATAGVGGGSGASAGGTDSGSFFPAVASGGRSGGGGGNGVSASGRLDRAVSSSSMNNSRGVPSIDEEPGEVFSMEEVDDTRRASNGGGGGGIGWNTAPGGRSSPFIGPIGGSRITTTALNNKTDDSSSSNSNNNSSNRTSRLVPLNV